MVVWKSNWFVHIAGNVAGVVSGPRLVEDVMVTVARQVDVLAGLILVAMVLYC
jgi:hypothetical protein